MTNIYEMMIAIYIYYLSYHVFSRKNRKYSLIFFIFQIPDLLRMRAILASKLEMNPGAGPEPPITSLTMLRLMFNVSRAAANHLGLKDLFPETALPDQLLHQLEILACDSLTLQHRPAEVALALLAANFQQRATREPGHATALMGFISELQKYCNVSYFDGNF